MLLPSPPKLNNIMNYLTLLLLLLLLLFSYFVCVRVAEKVAIVRQLYYCMR